MTLREVEFANGSAGESPRPMGVAEAYDYCRDLTRRSGSSFSAAFWLFSSERRRAVHAIYAFCRLADDIADDPSIRGNRSLLLDRWRAELDAAYRGAATHPVGIALSDSIERFDLPRYVFDHLLRGIESDLRGDAIETFSDLETYCYRVASTVGLLVVALLGFRGPEVLEYAKTLGIAVPLANVLRDVTTDAVSGRIYLPREDLERFGIAESDLQLPNPTPELRTLMAYYAEHARILFERADALLPRENRQDLRAAQAMGRIYSRLLDELHRQGFRNPRAPGEPIRLSNRRRWIIAAGTWFGTSRA